MLSLLDFNIASATDATDSFLITLTRAPENFLGACGALQPLLNGGMDRKFLTAVIAAVMAGSISDAYQGGSDLNIEQLMKSSKLSKANAADVYQKMRPILESSAPVEDSAIYL